jgi:anti-sigma factor RsiW
LDHHVLACRELVELVTDYLEGALPPDRHREVHEHLHECADCLRYLGQVQLTSRLLAQLPTAELSDEFSNELARAARADPPSAGAPADSTEPWSDGLPASTCSDQRDDGSEWPCQARP